MRRAIMLMLLAGCNQVFGLDDTVGIDPYARCTPQPFDPGRYSPQNGGGFSWMGAQDLCHFIGMELAVLDRGDEEEIATELNGAPLPFWLGVSYTGTAWHSIDECEPQLAWAPKEPSSPTIGDCVLQTTGGMRNLPCTLTMNPSGTFNALCETPRASTQCLHNAEERNYQVAGTGSYPDALAMCSAINMHVLEINSSGEFDYIQSHYSSTTPTFWIGAVRTGGIWGSPTSCPQVFKWASNDPSPNGDCAFYQAGMRNDNCANPNLLFGVICERNGP